MRPQLGVHLLKHPEKIRADAVHFIDKGDAWHPVFVSLVPDSLGLWFDAPTAQKIATAPSSTRSERSTSIVKST